MLGRIQRKLLAQTTKNYNTVAKHYSKTRQRSWPAGEYIFPEIQSRLCRHDSLLDLGAGSGVLVDYLRGCDMPLAYLGFDTSSAFMHQARTKFGSQYSQITCSWQVGSMLELPFEDDSFDHVIAVASLHHIPSRSLRQHALDEMYRVCKPGGFVYSTNWYIWTPAAFKAYKLYRQLFAFLKGYDVGDFMIPWRTEDGRMIAKRYVHAFRPDEVDTMCQSAGFVLTSKTSLQRRSPHSLAQSLVTVAQKPALNQVHKNDTL